MPTRKEFGLLVALGLIVTVVVFPLGFFASRALWPTSSQSGEADPLRELNAKYKGLFKTRTEIFKMNWCLANPTRCQDGTFPTEGHEAELVRNYSKVYDADQNKTDDWYRCTTFRTTLKPKNQPTTRLKATNQPTTLFAEIKGDNDRCCQT
ncbi:hypothetical protein V1264_015926 [Littorina saxatilis]|uniref:Uncharacterized protein n=1 Tax=Littorina saxatilis TaxID=31220 RepID=A0AAN9BMT3_9CAEN